LQVSDKPSKKSNRNAIFEPIIEAKKDLKEEGEKIIDMIMFAML